MGWIANKFNAWASRKQEEELQHFLKMLKGMDGPELGLVVAGVTHMRHALEHEGHDVMEPVLYASRNPAFAVFLVRLVQQCQKQGRPHDAAALMVWLHTMRGAIRPELRGAARDMWREQERGFPHIEESATALRSIHGQPLNTASATEFPAGFTPTPV